MNTSTLRRTSLALSLLLLISMAGCADQITFSKDSRAEGEKLMANRDYTQAAGAFRNAIKQQPGDYQSHYYLGICYEEMKQPQQAIKEFKLAMTMFKRAGLPQIDEDRTMQNRMIDALAKCVAANDPRDIDLNVLEQQAKAEPSTLNFLLLARVYRYRNDPDTAIPRYNSAIIYGKENAAVYKEFGMYLMELGNATQSRQMLEEAALQLRRSYALNDQDKEVEQALRKLGKVPGPSLKDEKDMARPVLPKGPLPELKLGSTSNQTGPVAPKD